MSKVLSLSNVNSSTLEPMRKNRWIMQFTKMPTSIAGDPLTDKNTDLAFAAYSAARPSISFEETEMHRLNERTYFAGKPTWETLPMEFYDFAGAESSSSILWSWANAIYNPASGEMGLKASYSGTATLALLGASGTVVESWNLFYIWPQSVNWNELDASSSDVMSVSVTFRYDFAIKGASAADATSASPAAGA